MEDFNEDDFPLVGRFLYKCCQTLAALVVFLAIGFAVLYFAQFEIEFVEDVPDKITQAVYNWFWAPVASSNAKNVPLDGGFGANPRVGGGGA